MSRTRCRLRMRFKLIFLHWCWILGVVGFVLWFIQRTNFQQRNTLQDQAVFVRPTFKLLSLVAIMNPLSPHKDIYADACKMSLLKKDSDGYLDRCMYNLEVWQHLNTLFCKGHSKSCVHICSFRIYLKAFKHNGPYI